jgi:tetratricopeptide (TPR) repeat protein
MIDGGFDPNPVWFQKAEQALGRARALDPSNATARFALGTLYLVRGQKREAYREFTACLPLMPNVWTLYHYFAYLYRLCDMLDEGIRMELRALEIDPGLPWPYWGCIRMELLRGMSPPPGNGSRNRASGFGSHPRFYAMELTILCREHRDAAARDYAGRNDAELVGYSEFYRGLWHIRQGESALARRT